MKNLIAIALVLTTAGRLPAQEKEFVLDTATGVVSQKDRQQDTEIAALKKELADLKAKITTPVAGRPACPAGCD